MNDSNETPTTVQENDNIDFGDEELLPWPTSTIFIWTIGVAILFYFLSFIGGFGAGFIHVIYVNIDISMPDLIKMFTSLSNFVGISIALIFLYHKKSQTSLRLLDVWGPKRIKIGQIILSIFFGLSISIFWLLTFKFYFPTRLASQIWNFYWHITIPMKILIYAALTGIFEEILYRGLWYRSLCEHMSKWEAIFTSSIIFTLFHFELLTDFPINGIFIFIFGITTAILFTKTKSLSSPILCHFALNTGMFVIPYFL